ncbi:MAG: hypothetical protein GXY52_10980 [Chloroflexi bacterium]|nr:hypothetical protein [Chloroflexota bacterium]
MPTHTPDAVPPHKARAGYRIALAVIVLTMLACKPLDWQWLFPPPFDDPALLAANPYAPPCWFGIIPGETTRKEVLKRLAEIPGVLTGTIHTINEFDIRMVEAQTADELYISCYFDDSERITQLDVSGRYRLEEIIRIYGEPDAVSIDFWHHTYGRDAMYGDLLYDDRSLSIEIWFRQRGAAGILTCSSVCSSVSFHTLDACLARLAASTSGLLEDPA